MDKEFTQFLLGTLAIAFGGWGWAVIWGVRAVVARIDVISETVKTLDKDLNKWVRSTETRLAHLEEWRNHVDGNHG